MLSKLILKGNEIMKGIRHSRTKEGFEAWLANHKDFLYWLIKGYYYGPMEQDDLFQEASIAAWKGYMSFDSTKGVKLSSYIGTCVRNRLIEIHECESALRRPKTVPIGLASDFDNETPDYILFEESFRCDCEYLFDALNNLDEREKSVLLKTMRGERQTDIAGEIGCVQSLVSYYLKLARKSLKEKIA